MKRVLVTGAAGFIGFHLSKRLLERGFSVVGLDNLNDYYDPELKYARLAQLGVAREQIQEGKFCVAASADFGFIQLSLENQEGLNELFRYQSFDLVLHLAAQAGVRYSLINPHAYINSNIVGFLNILEACRHHQIQHLVYASSSSVYGLNTEMPFSTAHNVDHPVSLYAASKKSNELMAHTYSHLFGLATTGLRFFTVYGPWGRPDMAPYLFTRAILAGEPIKVFNEGRMIRDFTYVGDIVEGILQVAERAPLPNPDWNPANNDPAHSSAPYRLYNIGNNQPVQLGDFIAAIEQALGKTAIKQMLPLQPGDVTATFADVRELEADTGYKPSTTLVEGIRDLVDWHLDYYRG
jgi:UDP-glucuronate 4-epimerase